jgi:citrate lyase subunit beta / citryl-CoA lyase
MLAKAAGLPADMVFIDLEDSVAPSEKTDETRSRVAATLASDDWAAQTRGVRVNDVTTAWCYRDITGVIARAGDALDVIVLPKTTGPDHVAFVHHLLTQVEGEFGLEKRIGIEVQIEDPNGVEHLTEIADASDRIEALIFGPGDYAAAMDISAPFVGALVSDYPGDQWHYVLARMVVTARARGLQAIDGPYAAVHDLAGFRVSAARSRSLGCDGKWVIHPGQIAVANEVYSPSQHEFDQAEAVLEAFETARTSERRGATLVGGVMVDEASRKLAAATVARGRAAGLHRVDERPTPGRER